MAEGNQDQPKLDSTEHPNDYDGAAVQLLSEQLRRLADQLVSQDRATKDEQRRATNWHIAGTIIGLLLTGATLCLLFATLSVYRQQAKMEELSNRPVIEPDGIAQLAQDSQKRWVVRVEVTNSGQWDAEHARANGGAAIGRPPPHDKGVGVGLRPKCVSVMDSDPEFASKDKQGLRTYP